MIYWLNIVKKKLLEKWAKSNQVSITTINSRDKFDITKQKPNHDKKVIIVYHCNDE